MIGILDKSIDVLSPLLVRVITRLPRILSSSLFNSLEYLYLPLVFGSLSAVTLYNLQQDLDHP